MIHEPNCIGYVCTCGIAEKTLLAQGWCPCGSTTSEGCSVTGCPLYLKEEELEEKHVSDR